MHHTSHIEISQSALKNNVEFIKSNVKENVIISSVVKGDAYGHGIPYFVPMAEKCGLNHFSVFSADEAKAVLECAKSKTTIMIMGMIENNDIEWAIENDIEYFVFEVDRLMQSILVATKLGKKAKIHIELETGMNRTGFSKKDITAHIDLFKNENLDIIGICTHYAGAESIANYYRIKEQKKRFTQLSKWISNKGIKYKIRHTACSAATIRLPDTQMDLVRVGIIQYGFWPSVETFIDYSTRKKTFDSPLKRILSWKSQVMSVKEVPPGKYVGYGNTFLTEGKTKIACIPVGYSQGYDRGLSNQGRVLINGNRVSVIGLINMNMMLVDITEAQSITKGDEVVLIGEQDGLEVSVASFSELSNQLNYEMLTRLPNDIPRIIIE